MEEEAPTAAPVQTPEAPPAPPEKAPAQEPDWKAEAEKIKAEARKWEERAKSNGAAAKELEQLRKASMSDIEKAVAEAESKGRTEALRTVGSRLVDAEVRVASAGRHVNVDALLEGLDRARFLNDDGEPDTKAISAWVDRIAPKTEPPEPKFPDLGQGRRQGAPGPSVESGAALYAAKHGKT